MEQTLYPYTDNERRQLLRAIEGHHFELIKATKNTKGNRGKRLVALWLYLLY